MKETGAEIEEVIMQALSHETRRTVLKMIDSNEEGTSYTELMLELGLSTGKLNYHLGKLEGLVGKNYERRYVLTPLGRRAVSFLSSIAQNIGPDEVSCIKTAQLAQRSNLSPLVRSSIYVGMAWISVVLIVWGFLVYTAVTEGAPLIVYVLLPVLISLGFAGLGWLIYALKSAPEILKRFEKRLFRL